MIRDSSHNPHDQADVDAAGARRRSWIQKSPEVCGGEACLRNTRITVWGLVEWRRAGLSDKELLERVPGLTLEDIEVAREYYQQHADEIERAIRENEYA